MYSNLRVFMIVISVVGEFDHCGPYSLLIRRQLDLQKLRYFLKED